MDKIYLGSSFFIVYYHKMRIGKKFINAYS